MIKIEEALKVLSKELKEDPDYRNTWVANIAMAFKDEVELNGIHAPNKENHSILMTREMLHKIANDGADKFLNILTQ